MTRRPPPEWLFLLTLSIVAGLAELAFVIVNLSSLPRFLEKGLGLASLPGIATAVFYTAEAVGNSPMGALADRLGRRRLMVAGALLSVLTSIGTAQVRLPAEENHLATAGLIAAVLVMRALDGLGASMLWPSVFASVGDRCAPDRRARAMTVLNVTYLGGIAVGPLLGGQANEFFARNLPDSDPHHYAPSFYLAAGCFLLAAVLAYLVAPSRSETHAVQHPTDEAAPVSRNAFVHTVRRVPMLMLLGFLIFLTVGLIGPYAKSYFMDRFGLSESQFGVALLGPALVIGLVSVPLGHLSDRWGKTRSIRLGMGLVAAAIWGILFAENRPAVVGLGALLGVGFVLAFPAYMAYLADLAEPKERGGLIGSVRLAQGVGACAGAGLSAALHVHHAANQIVFQLSGALLTVGFVMSLFTIREKKGSPK